MILYLFYLLVFCILTFSIRFVLTIWPILNYIFQCYKIKFIKRVKSYFDKPYNCKNFIIPFKVNEDFYIYNFLGKYNPKSNYDVIAITNEHLKDVSKIVLQFAGPCGNFFGLEITPEQLGFNEISINGITIKQNETIPDLNLFV